MFTRDMCWNWSRCVVQIFLVQIYVLLVCRPRVYPCWVIAHGRYFNLGQCRCYKTSARFWLQRDHVISLDWLSTSGTMHHRGHSTCPLSSNMSCNDFDFIDHASLDLTVGAHQRRYGVLQGCVFVSRSTVHRRTIPLSILAGLEVRRRVDQAGDVALAKPLSKIELTPDQCVRLPQSLVLQNCSIRIPPGHNLGMVVHALAPQAREAYWV